MAQVPATVTRMRQRRRQRLLVIAVLLLLLMGGAAYYFLFKPSGPREEARPPGTVAVPVAKAKIPMGGTIRLGQMRLRYFKPLEVPPEALLKPFQFHGRIALRDIEPGDFLTARDVSEKGAPNGFSGLAQPGRRVVVVETWQISGTLGYINKGDHLDVLAIGSTDPATAKSGGGVSGPGSPKPKAPAPAPDKGKATLVAEDAVVLIPPSRDQLRPRSTDKQYAVLEMEPGDAYQTALALGSGASLRFVFRPFNDPQRVTPEAAPQQTTYVERDARSVEVFSGTERAVKEAAMGR